MSVRKRRDGTSWEYDFTMSGHARQRVGGWHTKAEAMMAEKRKREELLAGGKEITFGEAFERYKAATNLTDRTRDEYARYWERDLREHIAHLYLEEIDTECMDALKATFPPLAGGSVNNRLGLIGAVLNFMWRRGRIKHVPFIPRESKARKAPRWYTASQRDTLLEGFFEDAPQWYAFFYITCRLGMRLGEVWALTRRDVVEVPPSLHITKSWQRGTKTRKPLLKTRKAENAITLGVSQDLIDAIKWHIGQGYTGRPYLFFEGALPPTYLDSHKGALLRMQRRLGLPEFSHHYVGRHSVGSQANEAGKPQETIRRQLGHRNIASTEQYVHASRTAQTGLVETLRPRKAPHED